MPQIDPKATFWFGVWTNVLMLIASYGIDHAPPLIAQYAPTVQWLAGFSYKINSVVLTALVGLSSTGVGPLIRLPEPPNFTPTVVKVLIAAFVLSMFLADGSAFAQGSSRPRLPIDPLGLNGVTIAGTKAAPAPDATAAQPCGVKMLGKLTPDNLVPTIKGCLSDVNVDLVGDTQRALDSAKAFVGNGGGAAGDGDAVNCLTPALAIFKAGVQVPAVPAKAAVPATETTPAIAAVAAVPAQDPGPILLTQKYREFTLAGGLTACQAWINGPINATAAAGVGAAASALSAAAVLAPK